MKKQSRKQWKKSKYITGMALLLAALEMLMIFVGNHLQTVSNQNLQEAYKNQIKYKTLAMELKECSDYLTNEVRAFASTGQMQHFENYWREARQRMRREEILEEIEKADIPAQEERDLEKAKYFSDTLMHIEISSMRLMLEAKEVTKVWRTDSSEEEFLNRWITYVKDYPLEEDYQVADGEKSDMAESILYGSSYTVYKGLIDTNVERFQTRMNQRLNETVEQANQKYRQAFFIQIFFGIGEFAVLVLLLTLFQRWYIRPVTLYKKTIERQHGRRKMFVEPAGVWELQQFAEEFNGLSAEMLTELNRSERIERELLEAKKQAEKANRVKSQFLTQMSHELRTPLHTISGYLFLLEDTKLSGEQKRYAENMHLATDLLLEEINEILDYSKLESGKMTFEEKNFSLRQLTDTLHGILENEAEQRNLSFTVEIGEEVPEYIYGDPLRLRQVLTNLVYNGFKFTKTGGVKVTIRGLHFTGKHCVLEFSVEDTGIGIKREQRQAIFDAFAQADESITRKYGGTGLGLPICRKIVEEMSHGQYSLLLESEEGCGSRFFFDMDFLYGKKEKVRKKETAVQKKKKRKLSVLIVDDHPVNLILEAELLHKFGYIADTEADGEQVVERMRQQHYDLVFLDLSMPKISGYEVSRQIRNNPEWNNVILVALTANIGEDVEAKVREAGMNDYLPKPVPMERLKNLLEKYTNEIHVIEKEHGTREEGELVAFRSLEQQFYGDQEAVRELLTIFSEDNEGALERLQQLQKEQNWEQLEMEVHRIKGVSGNLCCRPLEEKAKLCLNGIKKQIWKEADWQAFADVFLQTMEAIRRYVIKENDV